MRSAKGCFAWLTSPLALKRWSRLSGVELEIPPEIESNKSYFAENFLGEKSNNANSSALSEDYVFHHAGEFDAAARIRDSIKVDGLWNDLAISHLALVSDEILSHFAMTACEVAQHVVIDDETGTAKDGLLFNQENVPAETLFYAALQSKTEAALNQLSIPNPIQLGGDATTGLGFCSTSIAPQHE